MAKKRGHSLINSIALLHLEQLTNSLSQKFKLDSALN
jgi:hypothetical protein